jgi:hypothetical protein
MGTTSIFFVTERKVHTQHVSNIGPQNTPRHSTKLSIPSNMARGFCARPGWTVIMLKVYRDFPLSFISTTTIIILYWFTDNASLHFYKF